MKINLLFISLSIFSITAFAHSTVKKDAKELMNDSRRVAKNSVREAKDKTCELIRGKMECAVQRTKHVIQKGADQVEDAID